MADGVLLDTSFLISFVDPTRGNHQVALRYFRHFVDEGIPMFLSTIVASEFQLGQPVEDLPLDAIIPLPFNLEDAIAAGSLDFTAHKGEAGTQRDALKDDFKILGQAKAQDIAFVITEDARTLYRYAIRLRAMRRLSTQAIKLVDGFDKSHFDPLGQHDFDDDLGGEAESDDLRS